MLKKLFESLFNVIVSLLIIVMLYSVFSTVVLKQNYVKIFNHTFFVVASGSMSGTINVDDVVIVRIGSDFKENDIITYTRDGYFITHRVLEKKENEIILKGDINSTQDDPVGYDSVVGKVTYIFPFKAVWQISAAIALIIIVVVIFNFDRIFKRVLIKKALPKEEAEKVKEIYLDENKIVEDLIAKIKGRTGFYREPGMTDWYRNLRYVTKMIELLKMNKKEFLPTLTEKYIPKYNDNNILDSEVKDNISNLSYDSISVILLNCIVFEDREIFDEVFELLKIKIEKDM